jgi:hypothetical protein
MRVVFGDQDDDNPGLFSGQAWIDAAETWARERGVKVERWQVDQRFGAGGRLYRVAWRDGAPPQLGEWVISEVSK